MADIIFCKQKDTQETVTYPFDFSDGLAPGETIASVSTVVSYISGAGDPNVLNNYVVGAAINSSDPNVIDVTFTGGLFLSIYDIRCFAITSGGQKLLKIGRITITSDIGTQLIGSGLDGKEIAKALNLLQLLVGNNVQHSQIIMPNAEIINRGTAPKIALPGLVGKAYALHKVTTVNQFGTTPYSTSLQCYWGNYASGLLATDQLLTNIDSSGNVFSAANGANINSSSLVIGQPIVIQGLGGGNPTNGDGGVTFDLYYSIVP